MDKFFDELCKLLAGLVFRAGGFPGGASFRCK